jgi:predicted ArsR family transcriptional regulator
VDYSRWRNERQSNYANIYLYNWYNEPMELTTRLRIMESLRNQGVASAQELSRSLGMTRANVYHHLSALETNNFVEVIGQRSEGRGRPSNIYGLSHHLLGDGLDKLSSMLLDELLGHLHGSKREEGLRSLAMKLGGDFVDLDAGSLINRLTELVNLLNQSHYQAHWEASVSGAKLVLGHCPFYAIIETHPELCLVDKYLFEGMIKASIIQSAKLVRTGSGLPQCSFLVI